MMEAEDILREMNRKGRGRGNEVARSERIFARIKEANERYDERY